MYGVLIALVLSLCLSAEGLAAGAVDYSKCAEFFNNPPSEEGEANSGYRFRRSGPFVKDGLRRIPFSLRKDGSIEVDDDVISKETRLNENGVETVIYYKSPPWEELISGHLGTKTPRTAKVIIRRNIYGNISEIIEDQNLLEEEIEAMRAASPAWKTLNLRSNDRFFAYIATRTEFEMMNGQCVPTQSVDVLLRETPEGDRKTENVRYNTKLCRDINAFLDENLALESAFNTRLNKKMQNIFSSNEELVGLTPRTIPFLSKAEVDANLKEIFSSSKPQLSLLLQMYAGYYAGEKVKRLNQELWGMSPVIAGYMMMANCYYQRLTPFFRDHTIWLGDEGENAKGVSERGLMTAQTSESVITGQPPVPNSAGGNTRGTAGGGPCQVPGYPNPPGGVANLGFSWCPASVTLQVRSFALQAAGAQCAIATGSSSTPEQIKARHREINAACDRLEALASRLGGGASCRCPPGLRP